MPLKLIPPRKGKSPNWTIRGTYLRRYVDRSAGTGKRALAAKVLKGIERKIERGELAEPGEPTFASAAASYMKAGGERTYLKKLLEHFGDKPLREIDQSAIDAAAVALYVQASGATRSRQVYTPVSAVLRHSGYQLHLRRPRDAAGNKQTAWLWPEQAEAIIEEAVKIDAEFGAKSGHLYSLLRVASIRAGVDLPERSAFHIFRHTYMTWMRRYAGLDELGLLSLGTHKDRKSVGRYTHVVASEEAKRAVLLPSWKIRGIG
jgi:hypothetical protein